MLNEILIDAGKSTMGGNILYLTGMVDKRTMDKYEKEAKDAGRESWYLSWALDTNTEERAKVTLQIIEYSRRHSTVIGRVKLWKLVEPLSKQTNVNILF